MKSNKAFPEQRDALEALRRLTELAMADSHNRPQHFIREDSEAVRRDLNALQQERDIRHDRETILKLIAEEIGLSDEPHQTYWERMLDRIEALTNPAVPTVPEAVRRLPDEWREQCGTMDNMSRVGMAAADQRRECADELDRAIEQNEEEAERLRSILYPTEEL